MTDRPAHGARTAQPAAFDAAAAFRLAALLLVAALVLQPLLATLFGGFKDLGELRTNPFGLPDDWQWRNYWDILASHRLWQVLGNSMAIATLTVLLTLAVSSMAAFAFAHLQFFGMRYLLSYLLLGLLFPAATAILPLFIKVRDLGLLDKHWGVVLPQVAFGTAMSVLLLRNAFRQLPVELLDSALVDGCGYIRYFLYVTLPLSRPVMTTTAIIVFVASWNNFLLPLIMLDSDSKYPWPLGVMMYQGQYSSSWQLVLAFITLTILPAIALFLIAQRQIVAGLTAGAIKG